LKLADLSGSYIGLALSASEVKAMTGWPDPLVNDYTSVLDSLRQLSAAIEYMAVGAVAPEGVVKANKTRQYFYTVTGKLYCNPVVGATTGWVLV
jgi:hypothetical protein